MYICKSIWLTIHKNDLKSFSFRSISWQKHLFYMIVVNEFIMQFTGYLALNGLFISKSSKLNEDYKKLF